MYPHCVAWRDVLPLWLNLHPSDLTEPLPKPVRCANLSRVEGTWCTSFLFVFVFRLTSCFPFHTHTPIYTNVPNPTSNQITHPRERPHTRTHRDSTKRGQATTHTQIHAHTHAPIHASNSHGFFPHNEPTRTRMHIEAHTCTQADTCTYTDAHIN